MSSSYKLPERDKNGRFSRTFTADIKRVKRKDDDDSYAYNLSISSDVPIRGEVLKHDSIDDIDTSRLRSMLIDHNNSVRNIVGRVSNPEVRDGKLYVDLRMSKHSELSREVHAGIKEGMIDQVSISYDYEMRDVEWETNDDGDRTGTYFVKNWEVVESSWVAVPADSSVGLGRKRKHHKEETHVDNEKDGDAVETRENDSAKVVELQIKASRAEERVEEIKRINAMGETHADGDVDGRALAKEIIDDDGTLDDYLKQWRERMAKVVKEGNPERVKKSGEEASNIEIGLKEKEAQDFSLFRLFRSMMPEAMPSDKEAAAFEIEVCEAAKAKRKEMGLKNAGNGPVIPAEVLMAPYKGEKLDILQRSRLNRVITATGSGAGASDAGSLVGTEHMAAAFIDWLFQKSAFLSYVGQLPGIQSQNLSFPRGLALGNGAVWIGENPGADITATEQTYETVTMEPHMCAALTALTKQAIAQSEPAVEVQTQRIQAYHMAKRIDDSIAYGPDSTAEPIQGIIHANSGVNLVSPANAVDFSRDVFVDLEAEVSNNDGDTAGGRFFMNSRLAAAGKKAKVDSGSGQFVIDDFVTSDGSVEFRILGYPVTVSNRIKHGIQRGNAKGSDLVFGNLAENTIFGTWLGQEVLLDPYVLAARGLVRYISYQMVDFQILQPKNISRYHAVKDGTA